MIYVKEFSISANISPSNPTHGVVQITPGLIYKVEFQFPAGCAGLVGLIVADGGFQLWPSNLGSWFRSDNFTIAFDDMYLKTVAPYQLELWGYNEDETYDHTVFFRVGIADRDIYMARYLPNVAYEMIQAELAKATAEQEARKAEMLAGPFPWTEEKTGGRK